MKSHSLRRLSGFALLTLLMATLQAPHAWATDSLYRFAPAGAWVLAATPDYSAPEPAGKTSNGAWLLALDRQIDITSDGDDEYHYSATKITSEAGVEEESQVDLEVDPSYQTIDIHFLRVRRGDTLIDAQASARITVLPQETQLRERIYNGGYNINVLLADIRVGDVVEYAYTIHSRETLFRGHYAASMLVGWSVPVHWQRVRVRAPLGRPVRALSSDGSATPEFIARGAAQELLLEWNELAGIPSEDNRPTWYSPWPRLHISDFKDWAEVARAVDPLYSPAIRATAPVNEVAREISAAGGSPEQMALKALQYVQEQVRYVSISIGHGAYRPTKPDTVLQRRYGDCKDKSVLLVALLSQLHIDAQPVLVNSRRGRTLPGILPTPFAFDHAIVRAQIGGNTYWLDGTAAKQYAPLSTDAPPDFEHALLLTSASNELVPIPRPSPLSRRKEISVTLDLRAGTEKPGKLTVVTRYKDSMADEMRPALARKSLEKRRADYLDYITRYYPSAKSAGPLQIEDDKTHDVLEIRELYELGSAFTDEKTRRVLSLHADELYGYGDAISSSERRAPLALEYPIIVRQHVVVLMPESWPVRSTKTRVDNSAFRYEGAVDYSDRKVELTYEYEALKDEVAPSAMPQYLADRKRFYDDLGYDLWRNKETVAKARAQKLRPTLASLFAFLLAFCLAAWTSRSLLRWDPPPRASRADAPSGISGWLIFPAIWVVLGPLMTLWLAFSGLPAVYQGTGQFAVASIAFSAALGALFVAQFKLLFLFYMRRTSAPYIFVAVSWLVVACAGGIAAWTTIAQSPAANAAYVIGYSFGELIFVVVPVLILTRYMRYSQRVRATFQEPYPQRQSFQAVRSTTWN